MDYRKLGTTGLDVSPICIGCMTSAIPTAEHTPGHSKRSRADR
jgi:aryl-alcohol dehydrogenase-like predicted oxidoreductase